VLGLRRRSAEERKKRRESDRLTQIEETEQIGFKIFIFIFFERK